LFLGVVFLLENIGLIAQSDIRVFFSTLWPIIIIFFGLSILSRGGRALFTVSIVIAIAILALSVLFLLNPGKYKNNWQEFKIRNNNAYDTNSNYTE